MRDIFELYSNYGRRLMHTLTRSQIERYTMPSPVINKEFYCCESLRVGFRIYTWLFTIAWYFFSFHPSFAVLTTNCILLNVLRSKLAHRIQYINFTIAYFIRLKTNR